MFPKTTLEFSGPCSIYFIWVLKLCAMEVSAMNTDFLEVVSGFFTKYNLTNAALHQREYMASRFVNANGKVRTLRARLVAEVPRVLEWWRRIQ